MNEPETPTPPAEPGALQPAAARPLRWRIARFCLLGLATLLTLLVLLHVEENWRGQRAWKHYKSDREAQGAVFELEKLAPPPVPDEDNFAMTPLLRPLLDFYPPDTVDTDGTPLVRKDPEGMARAEAIQLEDPDNRLPRPAGSTPERAEGFAVEYQEIVPVPDTADWQLGERIDLSAWQRYYSTSTNVPSWSEPRDPAADVLKALSRFDAPIAELKKAGKRPHSRFKIRYEEENPITILLPHLGVLRQIAKVSQLRAVAELQSGDVDAAFDDVNLMFTLADSIADEPLLISHLVRVALLKLTMATVWEGLADHRWTADQLGQFQQRFEGYELATELRQVLNGERTFGAEIVDLAVQDPTRFWRDVGGLDMGPELAAAKLVPRGWWGLNGITYDRLFGGFLLSALPEDLDQLNVSLIESNNAALELRLGQDNPVQACLNHSILAQLLMPALGKAVRRSVELQVWLRMAATACALERYRLVEGNYPARLTDLVPDWMPAAPIDPVSHESFQYQRLPEGAFRLWSVGWNGRDDGGVVLYGTRGGRRIADRDQPDWVWPSIEGLPVREAGQ